MCTAKSKKAGALKHHRDLARAVANELNRFSSAAMALCACRSSKSSSLMSTEHGFGSGRLGADTGTVVYS